jgi:hypothetical protein
LRGLMILVAGLVLAVGIAAGCDDSSSGSDGTPAEDTPAAATHEAQANIRVVKNGSWCRHDLDLDRVVVYVSLRNTGDTAGEVAVTPVRYYSDGSTNDSALDAFQMSVTPGKIKRGWTQYDVDDDHFLIACAVRLDDRAEVDLELQN